MSNTPPVSMATSQENGETTKGYHFELLSKLTPKPGSQSFEGLFRITSLNSREEMKLDVKDVRVVGLVKSLAPKLGNLEPPDLLTDWGEAQKKVKCTVVYLGKPVEDQEFTEPHCYPLKGSWMYQSDRNTRQDTATLKLSFWDGVERYEWNDRVLNKAHQELKKEPDPTVIHTTYYFDGFEMKRLHGSYKWLKGEYTHDVYKIVAETSDKKIGSHAHKTIIYVEPFAATGAPAKPRQEYQGLYTCERDLSPSESLPGRSVDRLVYIHKGGFYLPHVTHEVWNQKTSRTCFCIASYDATRKIGCFDKARFSVSLSAIPEGLYHLKGVKEGRDERIEQWIKLPNGPESFTITTKNPAIPGIYGMGYSAPRLGIGENLKLFAPASSSSQQSPENRLVLLQKQDQSPEDALSIIEKKYEIMLPRNFSEGSNLSPVSEWNLNLNTFLAEYLKTEGSRRIVEFCWKEIDEHQEPIQDLRKRLNEVSETLSSLQKVSPEEPRLFIEKLRGMCDTTLIKAVIDKITFLKTIQPSSTAYGTSQWGVALGDIAESIKSLALAPKPVMADGILRIQGILVGTSDLNEVLKKQDPASPIRGIKMQALNTLFVDADVKLPSVSISLIAPQLKVVQAPRVVDLHGEDAPSSKGKALRAQVVNNQYLPPKNGQPGKPGASGGHFYAKCFFFEGLDRLTVNTSGGNGGNGGTGGDGPSKAGLGGAGGTGGVAGQIQIEGAPAGLGTTIHENGRGGAPGSRGNALPPEKLLPVPAAKLKVLASAPTQGSANYSYSNALVDTPTGSIMYSLNPGQDSWVTLGLDGTGPVSQVNFIWANPSQQQPSLIRIWEAQPNGSTGKELANYSKSQFEQASIVLLTEVSQTSTLKIAFEAVPSNHYVQVKHIQLFSLNPVLWAPIEKQEMPLTMAPVEPVPIDGAVETRDYLVSYKDQAMNPVVSPWVRVFPDPSWE